MVFIQMCGNYLETKVLELRVNAFIKVRLQIEIHYS